MKIVATLIVGLVLAVALSLGCVRFSDGPIGVIAGGPFKSGEPATGPEPDWSFVRDISTIEFALVDPARSRTTWILEHGGRIYVPCGYMQSFLGRLWKQWPIEAERDGRAVVRIGGKLYERQLVRIKEGPVVEPLLEELGRKYMGSPPSLAAVTSESLWLFELAPRPK